MSKKAKPSTEPSADELSADALDQVVGGASCMKWDNVKNGAWSSTSAGSTGTTTDTVITTKPKG